MINREYTKSIFSNEGFELNDKQLNDLDLYAERLVEWNEKVNLTTITAPDEIAVKHFLDSYLLLKCIEVKQGSSMIDVGTGAGFPSLPCKIIRNDLKLTLLDSLNKRINFLKELVSEMGVRADCVHGRAEEQGNQSKFRERYDIATARAVAHMRELSEYCLPFVKVGGYFIALKGYDIEEELEEAKPAIRLLGGEIEEVKKFILPDDSRRAIIIIKKISQTPTKFPRNQGKMKKQPLS
ncbi:MAG: 16S rRNA (guanine(527)-N(7))-methyltransferase RsmG [Oscillospiraceae bacterium]